jgi:creatinine amidohydrolase
MRIDEMTSDEFAEAVERDPVVILPMGATEAHGPHLPLGTDAFQPEAIADAVAERINGLVAPPIKYGQHSSTRNLPGTIGITSSTLRAMVVDILESLHRNGIRKVVIISGHAGSVHMAMIKDACEDVVRRYQMDVTFLADYDIGRNLQEEIGAGPGDGHGGMMETSRIMALRPDLVPRNRTKGEFVSSGYSVLSDPERCYPQGFVGDAAKASAQAGKRLNDYIIDALSDLIRRDLGVRE